MKRVIIVVLATVAVLAGCVGIVAVIGAQLPVSHVATRSILVNRPIDEVYKLLRDVGSAPSWRSDVKSVELLGQPNGKLRYREHGAQGDVTYELVEDLPNQRLVTRIVDQDLGYAGTWTTALSSDNGGTRVSITENGEVTNVLFRFMSRYVFGHTATIDGYLTSLAKHLGQ